MTENSPPPYSLDVPYGSRLLYALMKEYQDDQGDIRLTMTKAADILNTSVPRCREMANALVDAGIITRKRVDARRPGLGTVYRIAVTNADLEVIR